MVRVSVREYTMLLFVRSRSPPTLFHCWFQFSSDINRNRKLLLVTCWQLFWKVSANTETSLLPELHWKVQLTPSTNCKHCFISTYASTWIIYKLPYISMLMILYFSITFSILVSIIVNLFLLLYKVYSLPLPQPYCP